MAFAGENLDDIQELLRTVSPPVAGSSSAEHRLPSWSSSSSSSSDEELLEDGGGSSGEYTTADYPGILDVDLTALSPAQRAVFTSLVSALLVLSVGGNVGTLFVNYRRKIRPFFRACLISLACSDLLGTVFMSMAYLSQVNAEYVQIWTLGSVLCSVLPFCTTTAILANSLTLVGIALDRYFAVMRAAIGFWNPGALFCGLCMAAVWAAAMGIACPVICIYGIFPVYILTEEPPDASTSPTATPGSESGEDLSYTLVREQELVRMCVSHQRNVALYYAVVFGIIFAPCIVAFVWLNSVIAKKLWVRRHTVSRAEPPPPPATVGRRGGPGRPCDCPLPHSAPSTTMPSSLAVTMGGGPLGAPAPSKAPTPSPAPASVAAGATTSPGRSSRESRHLRMFTIVLLLMAAFLIFRLPTWIFLMMRMYGSYTRPVHWILYFSFGVLNLVSCVLNPLFYTFLAETIQYAMFVKVKLFDDFCGLRLCCRRGRRDSSVPSEAGSTLYGGCEAGPPPEPQPSLLRRVLGPVLACCAGCDCCAKASMSYSGRPGQGGGAGQSQASPPSVVAKLPPKDDADEGVECSEASDGDGEGDGEGGLGRIYTIYPMSLVSSSMGSE